ncbi:MAG TPA: isoleucine--tRNA ligase [Solirubrobacteraceae bacterium]|jgi:isoleucyl-tRNA synthetase|nr:isoleucine--tRNA ligase [Solirubrobacteraceae bacterium]
MGKPGDLRPRREVAARVSFPSLELEVLERWREREVFRESMRRREGAPRWVFNEGPPTANGPPGTHHVLSRVFKDIYPRYRTMRGCYVERKGGWDCHGLPVEIAVERQLGITHKDEIERYGIAAFNARCRASVFEFVEEWNRLTERIGMWIDLEGAYRTLDESFIESVWWALAEIHAKGLLYEGHKVVPYCPGCGTALSSHEVALGYRDVIDPSVYVRLPVTDPASTPLRAGDELLVWTTTPWTLPSNAAVAVAPDLQYVRARRDGVHFILAAALAEKVLGDDVEILDLFPGGTLEGAAYEPPFPFLPGEGFGPHGHRVLLADFVTADDGTGLVHTALAFGEDDYRLGERYGMTVVNPVRLDGTFDERIGPFAGRFVKDADPDLVEDLRARGRLLRAEQYEHSYPFCWRSGDPLLYYAKPAWYIATSRLRERLLAANETVEWHPPHIKHGRFGDWLAGNVDWALSRERYWGTPLPVWRCPEGHVHVIGSFAELARRSGRERPLEDHHRPFVDEVTFPCAQCGEQMHRVPEVIDVWFDSGAMPFAQYGYPHTPGSAEAFEERHPADFVCEALDQTRGWFYSQLAEGTLLSDQAPYRHVVCLGLILDAEGQKMSKSRGNAIEPWPVIERHGADALRWYFLASKQPWDGYRFSDETIQEGTRTFLLQLWSTYRFYAMYAEHEMRESEPTDLDAWALSRCSATATLVDERLDAYDATTAGRAIADFVEDLSNWYVRRSRRRFWDGERAAFATLRECLLTVAKLLAPFCPFVADEIYEGLDGELASVHLCDFPVGEALPARDEELEEAMAVARETVRLGASARAQEKIKNRQPLREAVVVAAGRERAAIERLADIVRDELNVLRLRFVAEADELVSYEVKPNYRSLGPRLGKQMPLLAAAIAALDPAHVAQAIAAGGTIGVSVNGHDHTLGADDLVLAMRPVEGYVLEREGSHAVALELALDAALIAGGRAREIVHAVQNARKAAGLQVTDRIALALDGAPELLDAARAFEPEIAGETLATRVSYGVEGEAHTATIDGLELRVGLSR